MVEELRTVQLWARPDEVHSWSIVSIHEQCGNWFTQDVRESPPCATQTSSPIDPYL